MNQPKHICDPRRIEQCLGDALADDEQEAFEAHLEVCPTCREALEASAAHAADWQQAREFLSSDANIELPLPTARVDGDDAPIGASSNPTDPHATLLRMHSRSAVSDSDAAESGMRESVEAVLTVLAPTDNPRMLGRLGGYEIAGVVGRGGMGVVLKALDPALNRYVAIKVLAPQLATSGAARQRFAREARAAASVVHENVVAIHAVADGGPLPYFVMPYLRGASLQKRIDADGPLGVNEILRVSIQIAAGLSAAHAQGLVHRDIKPANILLEDGVERLKITDFGLARAADDASLTRTGVIAGTPQFMSPEQARGEAVDSRSDLFSLGSVMYAMCTGRPPFRAETSYGTLQRICESQPRLVREINPEIPEWLVAFIERLHEKNPEVRFQTAHEVAQLLEQCLAHLRQPDAVPLPQAVVELAASKSSADAARRAVWPSLNTLCLRRAAAYCFASRLRTAGTSLVALAAIVLLGLAIRHWVANSDSVGPSAGGVRGTVSDSQSDIQTKDAGPAAIVVQFPGSSFEGLVGQPPSTAGSELPGSFYVGSPQIMESEHDSFLNDDVTKHLMELNAEISSMENRLSALEAANANAPTMPKAEEKREK